jgi:hypothetical protein
MAGLIGDEAPGSSSPGVYSQNKSHGRDMGARHGRKHVNFRLLCILYPDREIYLFV